VEVPPVGVALHDGDMLLTEKQKMVYGDAAFAGAGVHKQDIWPKGVIAYHFPWTMGGKEKMIFQSMDEWSSKTCIKFTRKGSQLHRSVGHGHYIIIKDLGGCFSSVGYSHKNVVFSLARNGCMFKKTILHELGHIIGLHHEQSRKDRDASLVIVYKNVSPSEYHNFDKKNDDINDIHIPYDYCSIMQYGPRSFSKTGGFTILTKDQEYQLSIGRSESVSFSDAKMVNLMYDCNAACPAQPSCREPCYVDHNCQCACPPRDECKKSPCRDLRSAESCKRDKKRCFGRDPDFDLECAETCGHCAAARRILSGDESATVDENQTTAAPTKAPETRCVDERGCGFIFRMNGGKCDGDDFLLGKCPKICGFCEPCGDKDAGCAQMAAAGKCEGEPAKMFPKCNRSCKLC